MEIHKNLLYFDIETTSEYPNLSEFKDLNERGYKLFVKKHQRKLISDKQWFKDVENEYIDKSALLPEYGKIVCISFGYFTNDKFTLKSFIGDEKEILNNSKVVFNNAYKNAFRICGYNIKQFDIPYINKRMLKLNIDVPFNISFIKVEGNAKKTWDYDAVDLFEIWQATNFGGGATFDEVCYHLNVESPKTELSGDKVYETFWIKNDIAKIARYCESDVKSTMFCAEKIFKIKNE